MKASCVGKVITAHQLSPSHANSNKNVLFWGLDLSKNGELLLDTSQFPCCSGTGYGSVPHDPTSVQHCGLSQRWSYVKELYQDYQNYQSMLSQEPSLDTPFFTLSCMEEAIPWLRSFAHNRSHDHLKGRHVHCFEPHQPWCLGVLFAWHQNVRSAVITCDQPRRPYSFTHLEKMDVVMITGVETLYQQASRDLFEGIIHWAYHGTVPVWTFEQQTPSSESTYGAHSISQYVNALKKKSPQSFLSPSSIAEWKEMTNISPSV